MQPRSIILELSEEADDFDPTVSAALRAEGFTMALDGVGQKRSNMDRLLSGTIDIAKLDRKLFDQSVVFDSIVSVCEEEGLEVVVGGVETMEQLARLFYRGVRLCQGYLIARPQSAHEIAALLAPRPGLLIR